MKNQTQSNALFGCLLVLGLGLVVAVINLQQKSQVEAHTVYDASLLAQSQSQPRISFFK